jgi:hypothetical protein
MRLIPPTLLVVVTTMLLLPTDSGAADAVKVFRVNGPTVVAFFPAVTQKQVDADAGLGEALGDFQFHLRSARGRLEVSGVRVHECYGTRFQVQVAGSTITFRPGKAGIGYYFIRPGSKPRVEYDVMGDADILAVAAKYFGRPNLMPSQKPGG